MTHFTNSHFSLQYGQDIKSTAIRMELFTDYVTTHEIPLTYTLLKQNLPSILRSKCFNENKLPFAKEVRMTEIGHLFEHILLEYLCMLKITAGKENCVHNGLTSWNWIEEARGVFHIQIDAGIDDSDIFLLALDRTIELTQRILDSNSVSNLTPSNQFATQEIPHL